MDAGERDAAIRAIARDGDPDRYAAALFIPSVARDRLFALIAFNVELARVAEQVQEPQLGEIRLQWWREALARALAGEASGHPVADAIAETARACGVRQEDLAKLIDARHFDVSMRRMPDDAALAHYLDGTAGTLFRMAAQIVSPTSANAAPVSIGRAAKSAGAAYGLTGLMRSLPVHAALGRLDIPEDALRHQGIAPDDVMAGKTSEGLAALLAEWRVRARSALEVARSEIAALPADAQGAFLPLALVEPYLAALQKTPDPLREVATINPLYRLWRLATCRFR